VRFELKLALRYLRSKKGGLIRLTAVSAVLGIVLGVGCLIIVQAVYEGFRNGIEEKLINGQPHITIGAKNGFPAGQVVGGKIIRVSNVKEVEPALIQSAVVESEGRSEYARLKVGLNNRTNEGITLGKQLAGNLNVSVGDEVGIIVFDGEDQSRTLELKVSDIIETGIYDFDLVFLQIPLGSFGKQGPSSNVTPNTYLVTLDEPFEAHRTGALIAQELGADFEVRDWRIMNKPLFAALSFERRIAFVVFALMILIAAFGIMTTLSLFVAERRIDIALLKTCGATAQNVVLLLIFEGVLLGLSGVLGGIALGLLGCLGANYFGLVEIAPEVYSISSVNLEPSVYSILIIGIGAFCVVFLAVLVPSIRAAKSKPMDLLRNL
jgi:lipoprotein-releasing system permease protein